MVDLKSLLNEASISTPGIMQQMEPMELTYMTSTLIRKTSAGQDSLTIGNWKTQDLFMHSFSI